MALDSNNDAELRFAHNVIEHLGIKLYKNKSGNVLAELIANSWDADSTQVSVELVAPTPETQTGSITVEDNGSGMSFNHIKDHYLHVGKPKRKSATETSKKGRKPMGRKGLGKLAPFGIARIVDVITIANGKTSWFTLDLDEILAQGESGRYKPIFHAIEATHADPLQSSDPASSVRANEFRTKVLASKKQGGTLIYMSGISSNLLPERAELAAEIGARFTVVLLREDFTLTINSKKISEDEALPKFELRIPEEGNTTELVGGKEVRYWAGFVDSAEWASDQAGVGVFAHGKIGQTRPYFFNKKGKEVFQRYLYAVVEADWIDDEPEDLISTDRTAIDWSSPKLTELHNWGQKKVSSWITQYEAHRKDKQDNEVSQQADKLRDSGLANSYTPAENAQIDALVSDATREIGKAKSASKTREDLLIAVSKAWVNQPTRDFLTGLWGKLSDLHTTPEQINTVIEQLSAHSVPEKMGLALTFSQRAFALTVLFDLIHKRSEVDLQKLVTQFPWILQPRGDLLTADSWLKTTIDEAADLLQDDNRYDPGIQIKGMSKAQRADFVFLTSQEGQTIKVVEIKSPEIPLNVEHGRQLGSYLDFIAAYRAGAEVKGMLVGNKAGYANNDTRVEVKSWDEVLLECRASYVEMLAGMLEISDIEGGDSRLDLIRDVGGVQTWELLEKLAETDGTLKNLIEQHKNHRRSDGGQTLLDL